MALLPVLDDVAVAPPLFVCVIPVVLEFDADELPLVTFDVAVPVFEDELCCRRCRRCSSPSCRSCRRLPPFTFPPLAVERWRSGIVSLEPVT